jgi:hypothetical protein
MKERQWRHFMCLLLYWYVIKVNRVNDDSLSDDRHRMHILAIIGRWSGEDLDRKANCSTKCSFHNEHTQLIRSTVDSTYYLFMLSIFYTWLLSKTIPQETVNSSCKSLEILGQIKLKNGQTVVHHCVLLRRENSGGSYVLMHLP